MGQMYVVVPAGRCAWSCELIKLPAPVLDLQLVNMRLILLQDPIIAKESIHKLCTGRFLFHEFSFLVWFTASGAACAKVICNLTNKHAKTNTNLLDCNTYVLR